MVDLGSDLSIPKVEAGMCWMLTASRHLGFGNGDISQYSFFGHFLG